MQEIQKKKYYTVAGIILGTIIGACVSLLYIYLTYKGLK